ncbi:VOC family protein, partial [Tahibacter sp.]|uniref:VOC family protein n=1 Tax=Tahibacter sp. TaxID=2056211 RepID=UPI0039C946B0
RRRYAGLETADDEPIILLQRVDHDSRVHPDIETDDAQAEAERLESTRRRRRSLSATAAGGSWKRRTGIASASCVSNAGHSAPPLNRRD